MNLRAIEEYVPVTPHALQVMLALAFRPLHGYGLVGQTAEDSGGSLTVGPGSVYRTVRCLERWGLAQQLDDRFALTNAGRTVLEWEVERARMIVHLGYERLGKSKNELESSFFKGFAGLD